MKKISRTQKTILQAALILSGLALTVACGKKNSDNNAVAAPIVGTTPLAICTTGSCAGLTNPAVLASGSATISSSGLQVDLAMDMIGNAAAFNVNDNKAYASYNGPGAVAGYMRVTGATSTILCSIPAGEYYLQVAAQGQLTMGNLTNAKVTALAPLRIDATILQATLYNPSGVDKSSNTNRLYIIMRLDTVNGQPCGVNIASTSSYY